MTNPPTDEELESLAEFVREHGVRARKALYMASTLHKDSDWDEHQKMRDAASRIGWYAERFGKAGGQ